MQPLKPYYSRLPHKVYAEISLDLERSKIIRLKFQIEGEVEKIGLSSNSRGFEKTQQLRQHGLWNATCFELFLKPVGQEHYYEFNWNTESAWNLYRFDRYRIPQPPMENFEFSLNKKSWNGKTLELEIFNESPHEKFKAGLSAILLDTKGTMDFFALSHPAREADFHDARSFAVDILV